LALEDIFGNGDVFPFTLGSDELTRHACNLVIARAAEYVAYFEVLVIPFWLIGLSLSSVHFIVAFIRFVELLASLFIYILNVSQNYANYAAMVNLSEFVCVIRT